MVLEHGRCDVCGDKLILKEKKEISGTIYYMLECKKCNRQIARHQS